MAVANDKTYYGLLKNDMPLDVFAYGTGGYGTLQEFMIIDQYIDKICPNVIILQFCSNDFVDNSYALEINSRWSSGICRPYLSKQGEIFYAMPKQLSTLRTLREFTNKYSSLLYLLISRIDILMANVFGTTEDVIAERGKSFDLFRESIDITDTLFKRIKERIPTGTSLYVFTVDDANPYYDELKYLLGKNDIAFIDGVPQAIREAEIAGIVVRAKDKAHWNEMGHQIAARVLKRYLTEKIINN